MKTKDMPLNMPCSDPEGCKHFKDAMKAAEQIKELEAEAERLRWISVNEKLPEEDTYLVLYNDSEQRFIYEADFVDKKWYSMTGHIISFITHYKSIILPDQLNVKLKEVPEYGWIHVSERLPELPSGPPNASSESVWLIFKGRPQMGYYTNYDGWRIYGIRFQKRLNQKDITYWMPIILPKQILRGE